ncbi:unnamed protein product [Discosporangium mesarthrocarpum]
MATNLSLVEVNQVEMVFRVADNENRGWISVSHALECLDELGFDACDDAELVAATVPGPFQEGCLRLADLIEVTGAAKGQREAHGFPSSKEDLALDRSNSLHALQLSLQSVQGESSSEYGGWGGSEQEGGGVVSEGNMKGGGGEEKSTSMSSLGKEMFFKILPPDLRPSCVPLPRRRRASIPTFQTSVAGGILPRSSDTSFGKPQDRPDETIQWRQSLPTSLRMLTGSLMHSGPLSPTPGPPHGSSGPFPPILPSCTFAKKESELTLTLSPVTTEPVPRSTLTTIRALEDPDSPVVAATKSTQGGGWSP